MAVTGVAVASVGWVLRRARVADAEAITRLHVRGWQQAYRGLVPDQYLADMAASLPERVRRRAAVLADPPGAVATTVAERPDGGLDGFAVVGPARDDDRTGGGELYAIYADAATWGSGLGEQLLAAALAALPASLRRLPVALWVLADNARARRFHQKRGWRVDGRRETEAFGGRELVEVRYVLDPPAC